MHTIEKEIKGKYIRKSPLITDNNLLTLQLK